jgi:hypothetical protein
MEKRVTTPMCGVTFQAEVEQDPKRRFKYHGLRYGMLEALLMLNSKLCD